MYYVKMNRGSVKEIVDSVDGYTVNNDLDFSVSRTRFPKGRNFFTR